MAILDGLKNAVTANATRAANKVAVNGLRNIAGNIFGTDLFPSNGTPALAARKGKYVTQILTYPANVEGDDMQGHYIIFEALETIKAKLTIRDKSTKIAELKKVIADEYLLSYKSLAAQNKLSRLLRELDEELGLGTQGRGDGSGNNSLQVSRKSTAKPLTVIALYMPPSISVSYNSKYGDQEIGALAGAAAGAIDLFAGRSGATGETALKGFLDEFGKATETGLMKVLDTVAPGANALLALEKGAIRTPRMELMFEGIGRREFSYEFTFIPKDEAEAQIIENIVKKFKFHMASKFTDDTFREMDIPSMFDIKYMYKGDTNPHLNKISTCALEGMDVSYGADRFVAYDGGRPQTTKISLKFKELEIITKDKIEVGF